MSRPVRSSLVTVIGRGRVACVLVPALRRAGWTVRLARGHAARAAAVSLGSVVLLTVPDRALSAVAARIASGTGPEHIVLHCAGALDVAALAPCVARGASVGVFHPLVSVTRASTVDSLRGGYAFIAGDARARRVARELARSLAMRVEARPSDAVAYHAGAALAANGAAALAAIAVDLLCARGVSRRVAERAIGRLLVSVGENVARVGLPAALTGPIVRGDVATVENHLSALRRAWPPAARAYARIAPLIVDLALQGGLAREKVGALRDLLGNSGTRPGRRHRF